MKLSQLINKFKKLDYSTLPGFNNLKSPLELSLWVLFVSKEKLGIKKLAAKDISKIITEIMEIRVTEKSVIQSLRRAGNKVSVSRKSNKALYEIMKAGKEYLLLKSNNNKIIVYYFEPEKPFTSKRILSTKILKDLEGELKIIDPYFGVRTLDLLNSIKNKKIMFLTTLNKLEKNVREQVIREIEEFKKENKNVEIKNYINHDLHDRYIISENSIVILGHSIKDLGKKESISVVLPKNVCQDFFVIINEKFNDKWRKAQEI